MRTEWEGVQAFLDAAVGDVFPKGVGPGGTETPAAAVRRDPYALYGYRPGVPWFVHVPQALALPGTALAGPPRDAMTAPACLALLASPPLAVLRLAGELGALGEAMGFNTGNLAVSWEPPPEDAWASDLVNMLAAVAGWERQPANGAQKVSAAAGSRWLPVQAGPDDGDFAKSILEGPLGPPGPGFAVRQASLWAAAALPPPALLDLLGLSATRALPAAPPPVFLGGHAPDVLVPWLWRRVRGGAAAALAVLGPPGDAGGEGGDDGDAAALLAAVAVSMGDWDPCPAWDLAAWTGGLPPRSAAGLVRYAWGTLPVGTAAQRIGRAAAAGLTWREPRGRRSWTPATWLVRPLPVDSGRLLGENLKRSWRDPVAVRGRHAAEVARVLALVSWAGRIMLHARWLAAPPPELPLPGAIRDTDAVAELSPVARAASLRGLLAPLAAAPDDAFDAVLTGPWTEVLRQAYPWGWSGCEAESEPDWDPAAARVARTAWWVAVRAWAGPLLAAVWGVRPGEADGFHRYGAWTVPGSPVHACRVPPPAAGVEAVSGD